MRQLAKDVFAEAQRAHKDIFVKLVHLRDAHVKAPNMEDLVMSIHALKEAEKLIDDAGKELRKLVGLFEKLTCVLWMQKGDGEPIRTATCTGSPDSKSTVKTPKNGTPEYELFCKHFGIDPASPFRPHWPTLLEMISADLAEGKPIPPGCDPNEMLHVYKVTIRNKKQIVDGVASDPDLAQAQAKFLDAVYKMDLRELFRCISGISDANNEQFRRDTEEEIIEPEEAESVLEEGSSLF